MIQTCCAAACVLGAAGVFCRADDPVTPSQGTAKAAGAASMPHMASPDPQMKAVLGELTALKPKPIDVLSAKEARKQPSAADAVMAMLKKAGKNVPEAVGNVENRKIPGPVHDVPIRVYTPSGAGPFPVLVYYHGGGWVIATLDTYDSSCRALCNAARCVVVSVEYRKAPENKYPGAADDSFAAYQWVNANAAKVNGDPKRIAVGGESAGGNLATVVAMMAKEKGAPMPVAQLLVYPLTNYGFDTESYKENEDAQPLNKAAMKWFWGQYLSDPASGADPHASPLQAKDLSKMPPAIVLTAQIDPLRSEGKAYADKLQAAGVPVTYKNYDGVTHEFFGMGAVVDKAKQAEMDAAEGLTKYFGK